MFATFACETQRAETRAFEEQGLEPEEDSPTRDGCESDWADRLPSICIDLPECPHCGGPSVLSELLDVVPS